MVEVIWGQVPSRKGHSVTFGLLTEKGSSTDRIGEHVDGDASAKVVRPAGALEGPEVADEDIGTDAPWIVCVVDVQDGSALP